MAKTRMLFQPSSVAPASSLTSDFILACRSLSVTICSAMQEAEVLSRAFKEHERRGGVKLGFAATPADALAFKHYRDVSPPDPSSAVVHLAAGQVRVWPYTEHYICLVNACCRHRCRGKWSCDCRVYCCIGVCCTQHHLLLLSMRTYQACCLRGLCDLHYVARLYSDL